MIRHSSVTWKMTEYSVQGVLSVPGEVVRRRHIYGERRLEQVRLQLIASSKSRPTYSHYK